MSRLSGKPNTMWFPGRFWEANTVADFWSKWNPAIHYMYFLLLRWIRRKTGTRIAVLPTILVIFLVTGLWHDGFIWLVYFGKRNFEYGFTIFFMMNAVVVIVERFSRVSIPLPTVVKKLLTLGWLVGSLWLAFTINNMFR